MVLERPKKYKEKISVYSGKRRKVVYEDVPSVIKAESLLENVDEPQEPIATTSCVPDNTNSTCTTSQKCYSKAKQSRIANWERLRPYFIQAAVEKECPSSSLCVNCGVEADHLYRCLDCATWMHLCLSCLQLSHPLPHLHIFEIWKNNTYLAAEVDTPVWRTTHACSTSLSREMIIIDDKGRQHLRQIHFCSCEPEAVTLFKLDLWAASPKTPRMAFHIDLLKWLNGLLLHSHVSVKSFIDSLTARISKRQRMYVYGQGQDVYQILMKECIEEFRHFTSMLENGQHITNKLDRGTTCPACFLSSTKIFSFDADFQLVRKFTAGKEWTPARHQGNFFIDQSTVDSYVSSYGNDVIDAQEILYSPKRLSGFGLTDGEATERLWSYLGKFSSITKEMTPENRVDLLSDGLEYYGRKIKSKLGNALVSRIQRAENLKESTELILEDLLSSLKDVKEEHVHQWVAEEVNWAATSLSKGQSNNYLNQMEEYSLLLEKFYIMGSQRSIDLQNKEQKVHDESLRKLEKKLKIKRLSEDSPSFQDNLSSAKEKKRIKQLDCIKQYIDERAHLLELMKKYAKGQAVATRIGRQLKKVAKKLNNEVHKYNEVEVKKIDLDDIKEGKSEVWNIYTQISPAPETYPPVSVKQQCIDLLSTKLRCEEEVNLVKEEMASCIAWLLNDYTHLISILDEKSLTGGQKSVVIKEALLIENDIDILNSLFEKYIGGSEVPCIFRNYCNGGRINIITEELKVNESLNGDNCDESENEDSDFEDDI